MIFLLMLGNLKAVKAFAPGDVNLISNPGFEEGALNPNDWYLSVYNDNYDLINWEIVENSHSGNNALHIVTTLQPDQEWALWSSLRGAGKLKVTPGDTLQYSVMVLASSIDNKISKSFITYDDQGYMLGEDEGAMEIVTPLDQYVKYTSKYIVPEGVAYVAPKLFGHGSCEITIDDFELMGTFHVSFSMLGEGSVETQESYLPLGSVTNIQAIPAVNTKFVGWIGDYVGDDNPAAIEVTGDMHITARFIDKNSVLNHQYYISTTGSDDNDGSIDNPWASITYGSSRLFPGDTLIVKPGVYNTVKEIIRNSGGNGKYITILGEGEVIFEGSSTNSEYGIVTIEDANYVILDGITVRNAKTHGIKVFGRCKHIILRNNRTEHTRGYGILVQGSRGYPWDKGYYISDILVEHNEIHWPQEGVWDGHLIYEEDITFMQGVEHFEIAYNYVNAYDTLHWHGGPFGIDVKDGVRFGTLHHNHVENIPSGGLYLDAWDTHAHHIDMYSNYVHNTTGYGIQIGAERGGPIDSVKVYNNIVVRHGWTGIGSGDYNGGSGELHDKTHIDIFNNTIVQGGYGGVDGWHNHGINTESSFKEGKIYNNILYDCKPNGMKLNMLDNNIVSNNCIYKTVGTDHGDKGANAVMENPQFVDAVHVNYKLMETSPCIDAGLAEGAPAFDFDGTARPIGIGFDIGAFEAKSASGLNNSLSPDFHLLIYPNPFTDILSVSYLLPASAIVQISVNDMFGKEIEILANEKQTSGTNRVNWDGSTFPAGLYFIKMKVNDQSISKKVIINR